MLYRNRIDSMGICAIQVFSQANNQSINQLINQSSKACNYGKKLLSVFSYFNFFCDNLDSRLFFFNLCRDFINTKRSSTYVSTQLGDIYVTL
jgi:hypothetical protein